MSTEIPTWMLAAQWAALFALAALVIVMYRQLGYYTKISRSGGEEIGLAVGSAAPEFSYRTLERDGSQSLLPKQFNPHEWWLLLFTDPMCGDCERIRKDVLASDMVRNLSGMNTLVLVREGEELLLRDSWYPGELSVTGIVSPDIVNQYEVRRMPFAYVISPDGRVAKRGKIVEMRELKDVLTQVGQKVGAAAT